MGYEESGVSVHGSQGTSTKNTKTLVESHCKKVPNKKIEGWQDTHDFRNFKAKDIVPIQEAFEREVFQNLLNTLDPRYRSGSTIINKIPFHSLFTLNVKNSIPSVTSIKRLA